MIEQSIITLTLGLDEINGILAALGELPTKTNAFLLADKIRVQTSSQLPSEVVEENKAE